MKVTEEFIREAEHCYIRCGGALYVVGSRSDELMYLVGRREKQWTTWSTDSFYDSRNDGI